MTQSFGQDDIKVWKKLTLKDLLQRFSWLYTYTQLTYDILGDNDGDLFIGKPVIIYQCLLL